MANHQTGQNHWQPGSRLEVAPIHSIKKQQVSFDDAASVAGLCTVLTQIRPKTIEVTGNTFGIDACKAIADAMEGNDDIQVVLFDDMFTRRPKSEIHPSLGYFSSAISANSLKRLRVLDLSDNAVNPTGAEAIAPLLSTCLSLEELYLNNTGVGPSGGKIVGDALLAASVLSKQTLVPYNLKRFVLGRSRMETEGGLALAAALKSIGTLVEVRVYQNGIKPPAAKVLAEALAHNPDLEIMDLSDNVLKLEGAHGVLEALQYCTKLKQVMLADTLLRGPGGLLVAKALGKGLPALETVNLSGNELPTAVGVALLPVLRARPGLTAVNLDDNALSDDVVEQFEAAFDGTSTVLMIEGNDDDDDEEADDQDVEFLKTAASQPRMSPPKPRGGPKAGMSGVQPAASALDALKICSPSNQFSFSFNKAANPLGGVPAFSPATVAKPTMQFTVPSFAPAVAAPAFGTKPAFPAFGVAAKPFSFTPAGTGGAPPSKNALSNVTPAAITGVLPPPAGPPPPGPPPPGKPTFSMPPSTAFGVGALAGAGTGTGPVQADALVAAFKKAVDGPSYAAVVGALAKLAAGLQREAVTPTVAMAAVDYGFTQSAQKASLLNTFMVALKLIKSEEPVADLDDAALEGIWKMVLLWKTKPYFDKAKQACVAMLASEESLRRRQLFDTGPYARNKGLNSSRNTIAGGLAV